MQSSPRPTSSCRASWTQVSRAHDYSLAFIYLARSIAPLALQRVEEAREAARSAVRWVAPGTGGYHSALSHLLWMEYTDGSGTAPSSNG